MAKNEEYARKVVNDYIQKNYQDCSLEIIEWNSDDYEVTKIELNVVIACTND